MIIWKEYKVFFHIWGLTGSSGSKQYKIIYILTNFICVYIYFFSISLISKCCLVFWTCWVAITKRVLKRKLAGLYQTSLLVTRTRFRLDFCLSQLSKFTYYSVTFFTDTSIYWLLYRRWLKQISSPPSFNCFRMQNST